MSFVVCGRNKHESVAIRYDYGLCRTLLDAAILALNLRIDNGLFTWIERYPSGRLNYVTRRAFTLYIQTRREAMSDREKALVSEAIEALLQTYEVVQ